MKIRNIKEITIKELKNNFDNFSGYLFIAIFLGIIYYFFLQTFFIQGSVSIRSMFQILPWILAVLVPAVTMGAFANEHEKQTIEYLITKPITTIELVLGKILGATKFTFIAVLLTLPLPIMISRIGSLDWGEVFAGYLGALLLIIVYSSIGVAISSFFKNQISAFVTTVIAIVLLLIIGSDFTNINVPVNIANIFALFSISEHYYSMSRGVLDFDDLVYFASISLLAITATYISVKNIRFNKVKHTLNSGIITILFAGIVVLLVYLATDYVRVRVDLTSSRKYTLSQVTKNIVQEEGKTIIEVYATQGMPYEFEYRLNELTNILEDYHRTGNGNIEVNFLDPKEYESELQSQGIPPVEFRNYGEDQLQVQQGYLAVIIKNEDDTKTEVLPFIDNVDTLEYDLTTSINRVKNDDLTVVGFASGNGERSIYEDYQLLNTFLGQEIQMQAVYLPSIEEEQDVENPEDALFTQEETQQIDTQPDLSGFSVLVIANPTTEYTQESKESIENFIESGGNVLYMVDMVDIDPASQESSSAIPQPERGKLLEQYGVTFNPEMVYDTKSHMTINMPAGQLILPYPYPLLPVIGLAESVEIPNLPTTIVNGWPTTINASEDWSDLYITTPFAGVLSGVNIDPQQNFSTDNLETKSMLMTRKLENGSTLVVSSSARIFDNQFIQGSRENIILAATLLDYLSQGKGFSEIRAKNITSGRFVYVEPFDKASIKYIAPIMSYVILLGIGVSRYSRRRRLTKRYS